MKKDWCIVFLVTIFDNNVRDMLLNFVDEHCYYAVKISNKSFNRNDISTNTNIYCIQKYWI